MKTKSLFQIPAGRRWCIGLLTAGLFAGLAAQGLAAVRTWTGGGNPDFSWSNPANWDGGASAPTSGDFLVFDGTVGLANNNDLTAGLSFSSISFATNAGAFVISGNTVKIGANGLGATTANGNGGVTNYSASPQTFYVQLQNDRTTRFANFGGDIISANKLWDWRWYMHGPGKLIIASTNPASGLNGNVLGATGGTMVFAAQPLTGVIGHGLFINPGGTVQLVGPSTNQIASGRDVYMSGGKIQIQTTNALGAAAGEDVSSLKSQSVNATGAIVENGSTSPIYLGVGEGNNRRGYFIGTIQDGGSAALALNVFGAAWQTLAGTNTYTGATLVTNSNVAGITRLIVDGVHTGGGTYTVSGNATNAPNQAALAGKGVISAAVNLLDYSFLAPGGVLSSTSTNQDNYTATFTDSTAVLTISNAVSLASSSTVLDIQLAGTTPGVGYDQVVIAGSGTFSNNSANLQLTVDVAFTPQAGNKFTLVQVPGTSPANNIGVFTKLNGLPVNLAQGATFLVGAAKFRISYRAEGSTFDAGAGNGNDIMLEALESTSANLTWRGDVDGDWDVQLKSNWRNTNNVATTFTNLDFVTFNDSGVTTNVNLTTDLTPGTILVNATKNYEFSGAGKLTGGLVLTKTNTGTLTLKTANDYAGAAVVNQGTLQIGDNGAEGALTCAITVNSNGVLAFNRVDDQVFSPFSFAGKGRFVHNGTGGLLLTNDYSSAFTGFTTNSGGALQFGDGTAAASIARLGGLIHVTAPSSVYYNFGGGTAQTIGSSLSGPGSLTIAYTTGGSTATFGSTATNSSFTGTLTIKPYTRVEISTAASQPAGPIVVESDGSGGNGSFYPHVANFTNANAITIAGPGPGGASGPIDTPRGKGALRLGNGWSGPIILSANATIGASAGTGTILGNISDGGAGYTLELIGGTLQIGPTSGVNNYGPTLITEDLSGSTSTSGQTLVRALNSNPFSSSPVRMVGQTRLELNGNNLNLANLVDDSISSGVSNFSPVIANGSSTAVATLTLGADDGSQSFSGRFINGSTRVLNLTKVGAGTFTVTGDSTNTGTVTVSVGSLALAAATANYPTGQPVIGSGSFSNATLLTVASGATLDVLGRIDQTLTVNSGQTLGGSGTVNGAVVVVPGGNLAPGSSVGTLTVAGNVTLGGNLTIELNRALAPNSDRLATSGGSITGGGTLTLTNLGAALQAGDTFQVFAAGVSGITVPAQTVDYVNAVTYTWQNNLAASGSVTVQSVTPITAPTLNVGQSGNLLTFSWTGPFKLQSQTNSLNVGISSNWGNYPGGSTSPVGVTINPTNPTVFFRLSLQ